MSKETKTLACYQCQKSTEVGKFAKSKIPCECGGTLTLFKPLNNKEKESLAKGGFFHAVDNDAKVITPPVVPEVKAELVKAEPVKVEPEPSRFEKGQKVKVAKHEFFIYGVRCEEGGFVGIVEKDLGYHQNHKDIVVRIKNCGNGKAKSGHGMYDILGKFITAEDW